MSNDQGAEQRRFSSNAIHTVRTAQQIHVHLSAMADHKASILMGATFVIFTITIGQARSEYLPPALLILGGAAFFSAVFAVLAILPATHYRRLGTGNLLFFGSFTNMPEEEFTEALLDRLTADESLYRTMLHDLYQNGVVLERKKYRLLGYAYRIFLAGLTLSFIVFIVEYLLWTT